MGLSKIRSIYTALIPFLIVIIWISGRWTEIYQITTFYIELIIVTAYISSLPINQTVLSKVQKHKIVFFLLLAFFIFYIKIVLYLKTEILLYSLLLIYGMFFVNLQTRIKSLRSAFLVFFIISISISFYFSPLESSGRYHSQFRYEQTILHAIVFLVLVKEFQRKVLNPNILLSTLIISLLFIVIEYTFYYVTATTTPSGPQWWRYPPCCFYHTRHFGYLGTAAAAVLLGFICSLKATFSRQALPLWILLTITLAALIWSGGRAATGSTILTMITLLILVFFTGPKTQMISITIGFLGSFLLAILISEQLIVFHWNGIMSMIGRTSTADNLNAVSSGRLSVWKEALQAWWQSPIFGLGSDAYTYIPKQNLRLAQPHSMIIQFLLEWGLFGIMFLIIIYTSFIKSVITYRSYDLANIPAPVLAAASTIFALAIHGIVDGTWYYPQPVFTQILCLSILIGSFNTSLPNTQNNNII
jgi:O-antigen ligase